MKMSRAKLIVAAVAMDLLSAASALACPWCKSGTSASNQGGGGAGAPATGLQFNASIYFMLGGLFCVMGFLAFTIVKAVKASTMMPPTQPTKAFPVLQRTDTV